MANHGDPRRAAFRIKQPAPEKVASTLLWKAKLPIVISPQNILALAKGQVRQAVMGTLKMGVAAMSDGTPDDGSLDYAVREYRRLFDEARLEGQPWNQEATLDGLLI